MFMYSLNVDITGLAETNSAWPHTHLQSVHNEFGNHRVRFGHPSLTIDAPHANESYQPGGSLALATGGLSSHLHGPSIVDPSGLGWWSGLTFCCEKITT